MNESPRIKMENTNLPFRAFNIIVLRVGSGQQSLYDGANVINPYEIQQSFYAIRLHSHIIPAPLTIAAH